MFQHVSAIWWSHKHPEQLAGVWPHFDWRLRVMETMALPLEWMKLEVAAGHQDQIGARSRQ